MQIIHKIKNLITLKFKLLVVIIFVQYIYYSSKCYGSAESFLENSDATENSHRDKRVCQRVNKRVNKEIPAIPPAFSTFDYTQKPIGNFEAFPSTPSFLKMKYPRIQPKGWIPDLSLISPNCHALMQLIEPALIFHQNQYSIEKTCEDQEWKILDETIFYAKNRYEFRIQDYSAQIAVFKKQEKLFVIGAFEDLADLRILYNNQYKYTNSNILLSGEMTNNKPQKLFSRPFRHLFRTISIKFIDLKDLDMRKKQQIFALEKDPKELYKYITAVWAVFILPKLAISLRSLYSFYNVFQELFKQISCLLVLQKYFELGDNFTSGAADFIGRIIKNTNLTLEAQVQLIDLYSTGSVKPQNRDFFIKIIQEIILDKKDDFLKTVNQIFLASFKESIDRQYVFSSLENSEEALAKIEKERSEQDKLLVKRALLEFAPTGEFIKAFSDGVDRPLKELKKSRIKPQHQSSSQEKALEEDHQPHCEEPIGTMPATSQENYGIIPMLHALHPIENPKEFFSEPSRELYSKTASVDNTIHVNIRSEIKAVSPQEFNYYLGSKQIPIKYSNINSLC